MNKRSEKALHRIQENDPTLTELNIGRGGGIYQGATDDDFSTLGEAIKNNTNITKLAFGIDGRLTLDDTNSTFYNGLKENPSIEQLTFRCYGNSIVGVVGGAVLQAFQTNNNLTQLEIYHASIHEEGEQLLTKTLRRCTNLKVIDLSHSGITDEQLLPMVEAVRGGVLQRLSLYSNNIGNRGCEALAALLADTTLLGTPNCNLYTLELHNNSLINHVGVTAIVNGLTNNKKLEKLDVDRRAIDQDVEATFARLLCNKSGINETFASHHTLVQVTSDWVQNRLGRQLESLLILNREMNVRHVGMKKILIYHPAVFDIEHLFEWDSEDERVNVLLPDVIAWYGRAAKAIAEVGSVNNIKEKHLLSAVYQFARAIQHCLYRIS